MDPRIEDPMHLRACLDDANGKLHMLQSMMREAGFPDRIKWGEDLHGNEDWVRVRPECQLGDVLKEMARVRERFAWWQKNAEGIAKERAAAWTALRAVEPFFREDMPDGPDGERGCATPQYRAAYRLVLAALKDRETLLENLKAAPVG